MPARRRDDAAVTAFAWRAAPWASIAAGALALSRTLLAPFSVDDRMQRAMALGAFPAARGPLDLYDFVRASERARFVDLGVLPWWTDEHFSLRFFRPLASALLWTEYRLSGDALTMHALSLGWWAAAVLSASWLFRRLLAARAAAIATLIFALAPCHEPALVLLAQREVLVATTFGILGLGLLVGAGPRPGARAIAGSAVLFAASLAAGEYGLSMGGYVLAWALTGEGARDRARRLVPFIVPAAVYLVTRAALGYRATGMGFYHDPIHAPAAFLSHAPRAFVSLVADAWSTFDVAGVPLLALVLFAGALGGVLLRATPAGPLRWLLGGSFLAILPLVASTPGVRLVGPAMVGVAPALGALIDRALIEPRRLPLALAAAAAAGLHLAHAPVASFREASSSLEHARIRALHVHELRAARAGGDHVGVLGLAPWETAFLTDVDAEPSTHERMPWRVLVSARHALLLRVDPRTLDVVVPKGQGFFPIGADDIFRPEDDPLLAGEQRDVRGMHVLVVSDGTAEAPPRIRFSFDRPLEDPTMVWRTETRAGFEVIQPPRQGFGLQLSP